MRAGGVWVKDLRAEGLRLTAGFHLSEDQKSVRDLQSLESKSTLLHALCTGRGIYRGGIFKKIEAATEALGRPYVSPRELEQLIVQPASYLSYKHGKLLDQLSLSEGMILVTCSGMNLGSAIWVRRDMVGLCASGDLIRVEVDNAEVPAGYVYALLAGRYGWAAIRRNIYGGNIKHIDPQHLGRIPVPRLSASLERDVDTLVRRAGDLRARANSQLQAVGERFDTLCPPAVLAPRERPRIAVVEAADLQARLDAHFHDEPARLARAAIKSVRHSTIESLCTKIALPGIFKRIHVDDERYGAPYYTGASLYRLDPKPKGVLSRKTTLFDQVRLTDGMVLVQAFGQEGGLTGRPLWVGKHLDGATTTHMLARLMTETRRDSAYLFGFLQSRVAYAQVAPLAYGGSIPHFDEVGIGSVVVPLFDDDERDALSDQVLDAVDSHDQALEADRAARSLVEQAIEEAA